MHLPIIDLDVEACLWRSNTLMSLYQEVVRASVYRFYAAETLAAVTAAGTNLDRYFCQRIVRGFRGMRRKTPFLVWYSVSLPFGFDLHEPQRLVFSVTGPESIPDLRWLERCPGWDDEYGLFPPNAEPFLWWNGRFFHRLYRYDSELEDHRHFVADFGNAMRLTTAPDSEAAWRRLVENPAAEPTLSPVPIECEESPDPHHEDLLLRHVWWRPGRAR